MSPEQCREQAKDLARQAETTRDGKVREQLELMVRDWLKMAQDAEELDRRIRSAGGD